MRRLTALTCALALEGFLPGEAHAQRLRLTEPATDSTFPQASCGDPYAPPTGNVNITGVVGYHLGPNGQPDTASVRVLELEFMSVAGFRSAVVRRLAVCRMTLPFGYAGGAIPVRQEVELSGTGFMAQPARRLEALSGGMAVEPVVIDSTAFPYPLDDSRVEEHPWQLPGCIPQGLQRPSGRYRTREEAERAGNEWNRLMAGEVVLQVTVATDGTVVPGSDSVVVASNPASANAMIASLTQCKFIPARIGGTPVPAKALARMTLLAREP